MSKLLASAALLSLFLPSLARAQCQGTPAAPTNVTATVDGARVRLTWRAPAGPCLPGSYVITLGFSSGTAEAAAFTTVGLAHEWIAARGSYYAKVYGVNGLGRGEASAETTVTVAAPPTCTTVPPAPTSLSVTSDGGLAVFQWVRGGTQTSCAPTSYALALGSTTGARDLGVLTVSGTTRLEAVLPAGTHRARVHALNPNGVSAASAEITVTIASRTPCTGVPAGPRNLRLTLTDTLYYFSWDLPATECGFTETQFQIGDAPGATTQTIAVRWPVTVAAFPRLPPGSPPRRVYVRVAAVNDVGVSLPSNELAVDIP